MAYIKFNGRRSDEFGLRIINDLEHESTSHDVELVTILGNDLALTHDNKRLKNVERSFPCVVTDKEHVFGRLSEISGWLNKDVGFQDFEMSWDPDFLYSALYSSNLSIKETVKRYGKVKMDFIFQGLKWYKDTLTKVYSIPQNGSIEIYNKGNLKAFPVVKLIGKGKMSLSINGRKLKFDSVQDNVTVDAFRQMVYREKLGVKLGAWETVFESTWDRPYLDIGANTISVDGASAEIICKMGVML